MKRSGRKNRTAEDSLENTLSCVPKVQGDEPNLSGKWTEMQLLISHRAVLVDCLFVFLGKRKKDFYAW